MACRHQPTLHAYTKGAKTIGAPRFKKVTKFRMEGTGTYHPDRWKVLHDDGTVNDDVNEVFITKEFGAEFASFVKNAKSSKFVPRPQFANKVSHLHKWPQLIKMNAPKVQFTQEHEEDLCIPRAFASVLHYAGFCTVALKVKNKFNSREYCYSSTNTNYKKIYTYASKKLPNWLQCTSKHIKHIR